MKHQDYVAGFNDGIADAERIASTVRGTRDEKIARLDRSIDDTIDELAANRDDKFYWFGYLAAEMVVRENIE